MVSNNRKSENPEIVSWKNAFGWLDLNEMPIFAVETVNKISK